MSKLYFRYGAMGSGKTANALMVQYNYEERGQKAALVKPGIDNRDGETFVGSRMGLRKEALLFSELTEEVAKGYDCIIVDEAQFLTCAQVDFLVHLVDDLNIPVICYGLRADFRGDLFEGSERLLAFADTIEEIKTICWCGRKATFNTRFDENHKVIKEGAQIVLGANDKYVGLCRKHWSRGELGGPTNHGGDVE
ncbi:MAG: thymidine kinase [Saccharofermentanales bacterium]